MARVKARTLRGRVTEIYGHESGGKTTLALHIVAEAQRMGGTAAYIDAEHALDPLYAARLGVNVNELLISQPDTGGFSTVASQDDQRWSAIRHHEKKTGTHISGP